MIKAEILQQYACSGQYLKLLVDDIPDDKLAEQPGKVFNHPAWQLGHLAFVTDQFTKALGVPCTLETSHSQLFKPGSTPLPTRASYPSKAELLATLEERRNVLADLYDKAGESVLNRPPPHERAAAFFQTTGRFLIFGMLQHEFGHLNQLAVWRRAMGMIEALKKL